MTNKNIVTGGLSINQLFTIDYQCDHKYFHSQLLKSSMVIKFHTLNSFLDLLIYLYKRN